MAGARSMILLCRSTSTGSTRWMRACAARRRSKSARKLFPVLARVDRLMRGDARRSGEDPQLTGYRCDRHLHTVLWTLREPCGWHFDEIWSEFNSAAETSSVR